MLDACSAFNLHMITQRNYTVWLMLPVIAKKENFGIKQLETYHENNTERVGG